MIINLILKLIMIYLIKNQTFKTQEIALKLNLHRTLIKPIIRKIFYLILFKNLVPGFLVEIIKLDKLFQEFKFKILHGVIQKIKIMTNSQHPIHPEILQKHHTAQNTKIQVKNKVIILIKMI